MEKLIELLNEYKEEKNICNTDMDGQLEIGNYRYVNYPCAERLCSKKFGFIKWLVDNDKIDKRKIDTRLVRHVDSHYDEAGYWVENSYEDYSDTDTLLMLLSIQENPIEFLISILK